jgi:WD40 repeat protein
VHIWNASTGQGEFTFTHHSDAVLAVAWSQDGKSIASAGADKTLQVWQPKL